MAPRPKLQETLETITPHAYFQPPENLKLEYPCIVYNRDSSIASFADSVSYRLVKRYQVTVIDRDPDSPLPDKVEALPMCRFERWFAADNLNHYVFSLFF